MKALLIGEYRGGQTLAATYETLAFAKGIGVESCMFIVGNPSAPPKVDGKVYVASAEQCGEINAEAHVTAIVDIVEKEQADMVVLVHSYYGWDLAPRIASALDCAQTTEVVGYEGGSFVVPACNSKLRRTVKATTARVVVTVQSGAFALEGEPSGTPEVIAVEAGATSAVEFVSYEEPVSTGVDLSKAEIIVSAGRGVGKKENIPLVEALASALGGEVGASRPVVDSGWLPYDRQVGISGKTVSPKLYVACGISGAVQHLAGMKKSEFIVAINTDKEAPIAEEADVLAVADVKQILPLLAEKLAK